MDGQPLELSDTMQKGLLRLNPDYAHLRYAVNQVAPEFYRRDLFNKTEVMAGEVAWEIMNFEILHGVLRPGGIVKPVESDFAIYGDLARYAIDAITEILQPPKFAVLAGNPAFMAPTPYQIQWDRFAKINPYHGSTSEKVQMAFAAGFTIGYLNNHPESPLSLERTPAGILTFTAPEYKAIPHAAQAGAIDALVQKEVARIEKV